MSARHRDVKLPHRYVRNQDFVVDIATTLQARRYEDRIAVGKGDFSFLLIVQIGSMVNPASYSREIVSRFQMQSRRHHSPLCSACVQNAWSCIFSPSVYPHGLDSDNFTLFFYRQFWIYFICVFGLVLQDTYNCQLVRFENPS